MVRILGRFPLDTNLIKWLSKCEGALQKNNEKRQLYLDNDDARCGN